MFKKSIQENILLYLLRLYCMMRSPFDLRNLLTSEAVGRRCSAKMVFLEISQNSLENTWHQACNFIKSEALAQVFSKFLRTPFFHRTNLVAAFVTTNYFQTQTKLVFTEAIVVSLMVLNN